MALFAAFRTRWAFGLLAAGAITAGMATGATVSAAPAPAGAVAATAAAATPHVLLHLLPSSHQLSHCMPKADVNIKVDLTTDAVGYDAFNIKATRLPPKTAFTVFLLEKAGPPFGAAEYIGDIPTDKWGRTTNQFRLTVQEAFSSTLVNGKRVRVDLNQVGMWSADPARDDFCFGKGKGPVTPFDGDNAAGVQAFNSPATVTRTRSVLASQPSGRRRMRPAGMATTQ